MQINFILPIVFIVLNTMVAVMNFKDKDYISGTLWAITVPLWTIAAVLAIVESSY